MGRKWIAIAALASLFASAPGAAHKPGGTRPCHDFPRAAKHPCYCQPTALAGRICAIGQICSFDATDHPQCLDPSALPGRHLRHD